MRSDCSPIGLLAAVSGICCVLVEGTLPLLPWAWLAPPLPQGQPGFWQTSLSIALGICRLNDSGCWLVITHFICARGFSAFLY